TQEVPEPAPPGKPASLPHSLGIAVDHALRDTRQALVGAALLVQRLLEELCGALMAEAAREGASRAVARDLVVLDALRRADQARIRHIGVGLRAEELLTLADDPLDPPALVALEIDPEVVRDHVEPMNLVARHLLVVLEGAPELRVLRGAGHLRKHLKD